MESKHMAGVDFESVRRQSAAIQILSQMQEHESLGVACAILLQASYNCPVLLRRALNEQVVREGFRGESLATTLARAARA